MVLRTAMLAFFLLVVSGSTPALTEDELHDEEGRLISTTDSEAVTSYYVYDEDGELVETKRSDGTVTVHGPESQPESEPEVQ